MKDEELTEEYIEKNCKIWEEGELTVDEIVRLAFLAGLKAGRLQWHDLEKDPTDLPKDKHDVWCKIFDYYGEGWYDKDTNTWTLIYKGYHLHCIDAWCKLPTFNKE